ncbi:MAG TPA: nuclear transport factor 2 family protein [Pedomonas sp.]|uniref:nuclear transport factor 2 family protein n=2 Tax=Pedomonas sp. TaxID=2976421 RepID=UPI002F3F3F24
MSIEENKRIVRDFMDATSAGDVERIVAAYADDGILQTMGRTLISGTYTREQVAAAAGHIFEIFPEGITFTIHGMTAEGDRVAVEAESLGRHVSGKMYNNKYHFLAQLRDGKITRWTEYCDTELITDILCGGQRPEGTA